LEGTHHFPDNRDEEWHVRMRDHYNTKLAEKRGSKIFKVWALMTPPGHSSEEERVHIADVHLESDLYTSKFGDEKLFFLHKKMYDDTKNWPASWRRTKPDFTREKTGHLGANFPTYDLDEDSEEWPWPDTYYQARRMRVESQIATEPDEFGFVGCPFSWLF